jgi:hypothetical protein
MVEYEIYHIPEHRKIGVTINLEKRADHKGGHDPRYDYGVECLERIVREKDDDESKTIAGEREEYWQRLFGYDVDNLSYIQSRKNLKRTSELGLTGWQTGAAGRINGKRAKELKIGLFAMTKEEKIEAGRKAGKVGGKRTAELGKSGFQQVVVCPYCSKVGTLAPMRRWHFENCREKE